jgi:hypothetical protein
MNYQFLCWYKILEGINWNRTADLSKQSATEKAAFKLRFPEYLPGTKEELRKVIAEAFPSLDQSGTADERWDHVAPDEVLGWKFNRIRQEKLEEVRNKIAHMLTDRGGDLSLSPDAHIHRVEINRWITLLRFMARVMIRNEKARLPQDRSLIPSSGLLRYANKRRKAKPMPWVRNTFCSANS